MATKKLTTPIEDKLMELGIGGEHTITETLYAIKVPGGWLMNQYIRTEDGVMHITSTFVPIPLDLTARYFQQQL